MKKDKYDTQLFSLSAHLPYVLILQKLTSVFHCNTPPLKKKAEIWDFKFQITKTNKTKDGKEEWRKRQERKRKGRAEEKLNEREERAVRKEGQTEKNEGRERKTKGSDQEKLNKREERANGKEWRKPRGSKTKGRNRIKRRKGKQERLKKLNPKERLSIQLIFLLRPSLLSSTSSQVSFWFFLSFSVASSTHIT